MNSAFHLRGKISSPSSLTALATTILTSPKYVEIDFGDKPPAIILENEILGDGVVDLTEGQIAYLRVKPLVDA
jgi:hypothetical protein